MEVAPKSQIYIVKRRKRIMRKLNESTKELMRDKEVFADVFNNYVFKSKKVIKAENLRELDTTGLLFSGKSKEKYRDVLKEAVIMEDDNSCYMILGIENESMVDETMPVRNMMYDALEYDKQLRKIISNPIGKSLKGYKLKPVITLVVYWGKGKWTGPMSLLEMMEESVVKQYKEYISDYKINVLSLNDIDEEELDKYESAIKYVILFSQSKDSGEKIEKIIKDNKEGYEKLKANAIRVIEDMADGKMKIEIEEGVGDMCKGIDEIAQANYEKGENKKEKEAINSVYKTMTETGVYKSREEIIDFLCKAFNMSAKQINEIITA